MRASSTGARRATRFLIVVAVAAAALSFAAAAGAADTWTASGYGTATATTSGSSLTFSYNAGHTYREYYGLSWTFQATAGAAVDTTYAWKISGCHSWYRAYVQVQEFVTHNGVTSWTPMVSGGGWCGFSYSGTIAVHAAAGDTYGFRVYGSHYDASQLMFGTLTLTPADSTPPVITPVITGTVGNNGWYTSDVGISWNVTDPESAITSESGCSSSTLTTDTSGQDFTCTATSAGGTDSQTVTIKRDATPPTISFSGNNGSYTVADAVNITCSASDATSGVASTSCPGVVSEPAWQLGLGSHSYTATATDAAGNSGASTATFTVTVDFDSLCALTGQFSTDSGVTQGLCAKLAAAKAAAGRGQSKTEGNIIGAFDHQVDAQTGKALTGDQATLLKSLAATL